MKKTDKKAQKQQQLAEFDASAFFREPVPLSEAEAGKEEPTAAATAAESGDHRSVQHVAPAWNAEHARVGTEGDAFQDSTAILYPPQIQRQVHKQVRFQDAISSSGNQEVAPTETKKKADKDKKAKAVAAGIRERDYDDAGRLLPRLFIAPEEVAPKAETPSEPAPPPQQLFAPRLVRSLKGDSDPIAYVFQAVEAIWNVRPAQAVNASEQFLWRSIYPQDEDGRPVYNPCGKYHVKLFFGGCWRIVVVDDRVPIDEAGNVLLCHSSEQREMWLAILAKAVYKLLHDVGYSRLALFEEPTTTGSSYLQALATYMLTGWLPDVSMLAQLGDEPGLDLVRNLARAGVAVVPAPLRPSPEIPQPPCMEPPSPPSRTRKGRDQEAVQLAWEKEHFVHLVSARERRVHHLQQIVSARRNCACLLVWQDSETERIKSRAVLAASVEQSGDGEWDVQLLVEYSLGDCVELEQFSAAAAAAAAAESGDVPLTATRIHAVWISGAELRAQSGVLIRYYLGDEVACTAAYNRAYEAPSVVAKAADEPKMKPTKKDGNSGRAVSPRPVTPRNVSPRNLSPRNAGASGAGTGPLVPPGQQPPTFATVQPIAELSDRSLANAVIPDKFQPAEYWAAVASVVDEECRTQQQSLFLFALSDVTLPSAAEGGDAAAAAPTFELDLQLQQVWLGTQPAEQDAMVSPFRVRETTRPFLSASIQLPVTSNGGDAEAPAEPTVLRLRALNNAGLHLQLCTPSPITVGDAAVTWSSQSGKVFEAAGHVSNVPKGVQQLFLRLPLSRAVFASVSSSPSGAYSVLHVTNQCARQHVMTAIAFPNGVLQPLAPLDLTFIPARWWGQSTQEVDAEGEGQEDQKKREQTPLLVAWAYSDHQVVPAFEWRLSMLLPSDAATDQLEALPPLHASVTRFRGQYSANKYLRAFKDVLAASKGALPLALRLTVDGSHLVRLKLRITAQSTGQVLVEVYEQEVLQVPALYGTGEGGEQEEVLLEVVLDEAHMQVPDAWRSIRPHEFKAGSTDSQEQEETFQWQLDCSTVDGSAVKLRHDYADLQRLHDLKASWEANDPGRSQRSQTALQQLQARRCNTAPAPPSASLPSHLGDLPSSAESQQTAEAVAFEQHVKSRAELTAEEASVERLRELKRACLPLYDVEVECDGEPAFLTAEQKQMDRELRGTELHNSYLFVTQLVEEFRSGSQDFVRSAEALAQQLEEKRQQQLKEFIEANELRTAYNEHVRRKNEALVFLYQTATEGVAALVKQQQKDSNKKK